jgi:hypothetical protein
VRDSKKTFWINLVIVLALVVIVIIRSVVNGGSDAVFSLQEDRLTLGGPGDFTASFAFADVASLEFRENFDRGSCVSGESGKTYTYGVWENAEFGQYTLHVLTKVSDCIVVTQRDGSVIVFNVDSAQTTQEFADSLTEHLKSFV